MYEVFDKNEMDNAIMYNHILQTDQPNIIKCGDDRCSFVIIDRTSAGLFSYKLIAMGGPASTLQSQTRSIRVCSVSSISSSAVINKKQKAYSGKAVITFEIPVFNNSNPDCSSDFIYAIYDKDCVNLS